MNIGDKVQVYYSSHKEKPLIQGTIKEFLIKRGEECFKINGSPFPYKITHAERINSFCKHDPFDRDIDWNENQFCTICGKITKTAEELYPDEEEIF